MKTGKWKWAFVLFLLLISAGTSWAADCPVGTQLKVIGTVQTASANITTTGHQVRASRIACAGTACVGGLYNGDDLYNATNALAKDHAGAPANTSNWTEYDPPLDFDDGITFVDDGNVNAIFVYECR